MCYPGGVGVVQGGKCCPVGVSVVQGVRCCRGVGVVQRGVGVVHLPPGQDHLPETCDLSHDAFGVTPPPWS